MSIQNLKSAIQALTYAELKALDIEGFIFDDMVRLERACVACGKPSAYKVNGWIGSRIDAIKELRNTTGICLAEAKDVIDTANGDAPPSRRYMYYFTERPVLQYVSVVEVNGDAVGLVAL